MRWSILVMPVVRAWAARLYLALVFSPGYWFIFALFDLLFFGALTVVAYLLSRSISRPWIAAAISLVLLAALDVLLYESFRGPQVVLLYVILVLFHGAFCVLLLKFPFYRRQRDSGSQT